MNFAWVVTKLMEDYDHLRPDAPPEERKAAESIYWAVIWDLFDNGYQLLHPLTGQVVMSW